MKNRLTARIVDLAHAVLDRFVEVAVDRGRIEEFEMMIRGATGNEAVRTLQVTQGAGELKPERLEVVKRGCGCRLHGSSLLYKAERLPRLYSA